jgi:hypothetical protein
MYRDIAYGPYFLTYEWICRGGRKEAEGYEIDLVREVERDVEEVGTVRLLIAGGCAGIVGWGSTYVPPRRTLQKD